jgi:hypothetical protein
MRTGGWRALTVVVVLGLLLGAGVVVTRWGQQREHDRRCAALAADVEGLDSIAWDNGITSSGPSWGNALTDGVEQADAPSREALAEAVQDDVDGFVAARDALDTFGHAGGAADRLKRLLVDPEQAAARADAPSTVDATSRIRAAMRVECGFV